MSYVINCWSARCGDYFAGMFWKTSQRYEQNLGGGGGGGGGWGELASPGSKTMKTAKIFSGHYSYLRRETTCIQGYWPCPQQTGLHRHRRWLKCLKFRMQGSRGIVLSMKRKQRSWSATRSSLSWSMPSFFSYMRKAVFMTHLTSAKISRSCQSDYISTSHI